MTLSPRVVVESPARGWRRYPGYKDSGVEWLGEVPEHWAVKRLKYTVTACQNGIWGEEPTGGSDDLVCVRVADFDRIRNRVVDTKLTPRAVPVNQRDGKLLKAGDLLLEKSGGGDRQPVGTVVLYDLDVPAVCSNFVARMPVAEGYDPFFLLYLHAALYSGRINTRSIKQNTGIQNLDSNSYLNEMIVLPPQQEQRVIAAVLDRETQKIDDLIVKREHLIGLLEEKRSALISRAVTKGLNPDVPMKDSGVEWLGAIPAHWDTKRLKFLAKVRSGVAKGRNLGEHVTVDLPYLRVANVQDGYLDLSDVAMMTVGIDEVEVYSLRAGDVLMNEGGDFDKLGRGTVWQGQIDPCLHQNHVFAVRSGARVEPEWLSTITLTSYAKHYFVLRSKQSTNLASISSANLQNLLVVVAPPDERSEILSFIEREMTKINALMGKVREHIEKLREYRTALISAAVTGKIDVRDKIS